MERIRIGSGDIAISWAVYDIDGLVHDFSDKELEPTQVIASLYDPAAEAEKREAEAEAPVVDAADVPADNGSKPEEEAEGTEASENSSNIRALVFSSSRSLKATRAFSWLSLLPCHA